MRRWAGIAAVFVALMALIASVASAATLPEGPRLSFGIWKTGKPMELKLETAAADGSERTTLVGDGKIWSLPFDGGTWSPDGSSLAFAGAPRGEGDEHGQIYLVSADGGAPVPVPGTREGTDPVFSPDGHTIAFSRAKLEFNIDFKHPERSHDYFSTTTWLVDLSSGAVKRLTPWRNGLRVSPTSFSPDASKLLVDRERGRGEEVAVFDLASGRITPFALQADEAVYSPDGSRIALISKRDKVTVESADGPIALGELYVVSADGSQWHRLTRNRISEEEAPSWDPSGQRLAFAQSTGAGTIGLGMTNVVVEVNADGSCLTGVVGKPRSEIRSETGLYAPTWRPGPGREAGAIAC